MIKMEAVNLNPDQEMIMSGLMHRNADQSFLSEKGYRIGADFITGKPIYVVFDEKGLGLRTALDQDVISVQWATRDYWPLEQRLTAKS